MSLILTGATGLGEFSVLFAKLALQLRAEIDEATTRAYHDVLRGYPLDAVSRAAQAFATERGRKWLPTTGEWTEAILSAQAAVVRDALTSAREQPWVHECERCEDTGWVLGLACDGGDRCGRIRRHAAHSYTRPCPCRTTNRTYLRHLQAGRS